MPRQSSSADGRRIISSKHGVKIVTYESRKKKPCSISGFLTTTRVTNGPLTRALTQLNLHRAVEVLG